MKNLRLLLINKQYFDGVSEDVWNGEYQPAQKWLKYRKNKILSSEELVHYQKNCFSNQNNRVNETN
ncbi:MAG: hypothetical protein PHQ01_02895 [Candidatus Pacebacteria bacterium]|nr:hypothetical protein [Candidatus Paceibacterota bacterium]